MQDTGCRIQITGYRMQETDYRTQITKCRMQDPDYRIQITGHKLAIHTVKFKINSCLKENISKPFKQ